MIDLILVTAFGAVFYGGFKVGNNFKTLHEAKSALIEVITGKYRK